MSTHYNSCPFPAAECTCDGGAKDPGQIPLTTVKGDSSFVPGLVIGAVLGVIGLLVLGSIVQALQECAR